MQTATEVTTVRNYDTVDAWLDALEQSRIEQTHWSIEINSPLTTRRGVVGRWDRWGVFRCLPRELFSNP